MSVRPQADNVVGPYGCQRAVPFALDNDPAMIGKRMREPIEGWGTVEESMGKGVSRQPGVCRGAGFHLRRQWTVFKLRRASLPGSVP
jgi:hypothetical protein